jgi:hypothetical protein
MENSGNDIKKIKEMRKSILLSVILSLCIAMQAQDKLIVNAGQGKETISSFRKAVEYLAKTYGERYPQAESFLRQLDKNPSQDDFEKLRFAALSAHPVLRENKLVFVVRQQYAPDHHNTGTDFLLGEVSADNFRPGGAIRMLDMSKPVDDPQRIVALLDLPDGVARDLEVHYDAGRLLFAVRRSRYENFHIAEMTLDEKNAGELRFLGVDPTVADMDPVYLPDDRIAFSSTRDLKYCGCNQHAQGNLFRMNADGSEVCQIGRNTLYESRPSLLPDGRILYDRWEYVGHPAGGQIDRFMRLPVKYEDPFPLDEAFLLCARTLNDGERMGIFLIDVFRNEILLHEEPGKGCYDPMPLVSRKRPPVLPDAIDTSKTTGTFFVADVYQGTGMEQVQRGTVKTLRVIEAPPKRFQTMPIWEADTYQRPAMNYNNTNNKRILGDVPVEDDGSAFFEVPADRFVFFQALDADGMMVQSMRSGTSLRPGEIASCVGCHDYRHGARINFTRPEQSDCLKKLTANDPRYQEAATIIRRGKEQICFSGLIFYPESRFFRSDFLPCYAFYVYHSGLNETESFHSSKYLLRGARLFMKEKHSAKGFRTSLENFGLLGNIEIYPMYAISNIFRDAKEKSIFR